MANGGDIMTKQISLNGLLKKALLILCASPLIAVAQEWPAKPITFVVPFPAGGGTDAAVSRGGK